MSLTRRILEGARSGLSQLTSLVIVDDEPLSQVDAAVLEAELKARRAARELRPRKPEDNPVAKIASSTPLARAERTRQASDRTSRIKHERGAREARDRAAADDAFRRMKAQSGGGGATAGSSARTGKPRTGSPEAQIAEWLRVLDLQPGADFAQIKSAYRAMMRKYHPDLHTQDARKQKAATELSMRVTNAYNNLRQHLGEK